MKVCPACKQEKPLSRFHKRGKDDYQSYCKICSSNYNKKYHQQNHEKRNQESRETYRKQMSTPEGKARRAQLHREYCQRTKILVFEHYGGVKCADCGEEDEVVLTVDHVGGGGNQHRKRLKTPGSRFYQWLRTNNYPNGYEIVCRNCNWRRRMKQNLRSKNNDN